MDQADLAQHGAAVRAVLAGAVRLDPPFAAGHGLGHFVMAQCGGINEALDLLHAQAAHRIQLIVRLDPFGRGQHAQRIRQPHDRGDDRGVAVGRIGDAADEGLVDLDLVERRVLQIAERGIAGAEIVQRQADAQHLERGEDFLGGGAIAHHHRFGQFDFQPFGRQAAVGQRLGHGRGKARVGELRGRYVHRDLHPARPFGGIGAGLFQHPIAQRADQVGFLGNRDEDRRRNIAQFGMFPAREGFERDDLFGLGIDDGLIGHAHLPATQRIAQVFLDLAATLGLAVQIAGIEPELAAPATL